jgi:hypothetical protein
MKFKGAQFWGKLRRAIHIRVVSPGSLGQVTSGDIELYVAMRLAQVTKSTKEPSVSVAKVHDFSCSFYTHMYI